jgi:hypothetical protein
MTMQALKEIQNTLLSDEMGNVCDTRCCKNCLQNSDGNTRWEEAKT